MTAPSTESILRDIAELDVPELIQVARAAEARKALILAEHEWREATEPRVMPPTFNERIAAVITRPMTSREIRDALAAGDPRAVRNLSNRLVAMRLAGMLRYDGTHYSPVPLEDREIDAWLARHPVGGEFER